MKKHTAPLFFFIVLGLILDLYNPMSQALGDRIFLYKTASDKKVQVTQDVKCVGNNCFLLAWLTLPLFVLIVQYVSSAAGSGVSLTFGSSAHCQIS